MRSPHIATALLASALHLACAPKVIQNTEAAPVRAMAQASWREVRTRRAIVYTDVGPEDARWVALRVEQALEAREFLLHRAAEEIPLVRAVVFHSAAERTAQGIPEVAKVLSEDGTGASIVFTDAESVQSAAPTIWAGHIAESHAHGDLGAPPFWLAIGLRMYGDTLEFRTDGTAVSGRFASSYLSFARSDELASLDDVRGWRTAHPTDRTNVLRWSSALWVDFLLHQYKEPFWQYVGGIRGGKTESEAWDLAFGNVTTATLSEQIKSWAQRSTLPGQLIQLSARVDDGAGHPLSPQDLRKVWLLVHFVALGKDDEAGRKAVVEEAGAVLKDAPDDASAIIIRVWLTKGEEQLAFLHEAIQRATRNPVVNLALARAWQGKDGEPYPSDVLAAFGVAAAAYPSNSQVQNSYAWGLVLARRYEEAVPFAERAHRLAPNDWAILDTLAAALVGVGRCEEGLAAQRKAIELLRGDARQSERVDGYLDRLRGFERRCADDADLAGQ